MPGMNNNPLVSICCLSYNQAGYIQECLDSFLMQQTSFRIEILIHDDASTDGTDKIIRQYAEKYPDTIFPLFEVENQLSKGMNGKMDITFNYSRARGKYIASCEGDDYWTDPLKLQKQVDFMESHPDYSVCFHRCTHLYEETGEQTEDECGSFFNNGEEGIDISDDMFWNQWITQPLSMLFRVSAFNPEWQKKYKYYRDIHEIYHLLSVGKGYLFGFNGGVYRKHSGGVHSMISKEKYCRVALKLDKEFYHVSPNRGTKKRYCDTLQDAINLEKKAHKLKALRYALLQFALSSKAKRFGKNCISIFSVR